MHDRTRNFLCRLGFLAFCVGPTVGLLVWAVVIRTSPHQSALRENWQRRLSQYSGTTVTVGQVSHPNLQVTRLQNLALKDMESGAQIANIRVLEIWKKKDSWIFHAPLPVEAYTQHLQGVWKSLQERVMRGGVSEAPFYFAADTITLQREDGVQWTLRDLGCRLNSSPHQAQATLYFHDVQANADRPSQLTITRQRQASPPQTHWELRTNDYSFPCGLLADFQPSLRRLGEDAAFRGTWEAVETDLGWEGYLTGRLSEIELQGLTSHLRTEYRLSGKAELTLNRGRLQDGILTDAAGELQAQRGVVSEAMLAWSKQTLGLSPLMPVGDSREPWEYERMHLGFQLEGGRFLRIEGKCLQDQRGVVMVDSRNRPLVADSMQTVEMADFPKASPLSPPLKPASLRTPPAPGVRLH